jgi:hypothetical protein
MASLFAQASTRFNARDYLKAALPGLPRKNCWTVAEHTGHASPDRLQLLLERTVWDERNLRGIVAAQAATTHGTYGVLIFDETGDLKKGRS